MRRQGKEYDKNITGGLGDIDRCSYGHLSDAIYKTKKIKEYFKAGGRKQRRNESFSAKTKDKYLTGQIVKLSEYAFCPEEIAKHTADMKREFEVMAKEQGRVLLDCVEDFLPVFGIEEKEHKTAEAYLEEMCIKQMKIILLGNEYLKEFHVILGKEQYEKEISRIMKKEEMSREEAEQQYSYESFLYNKCLAQVENAMRKYIKTQIKIKIMVEE